MAKVKMTTVKLEQNAFDKVTFTAGATDGILVPMAGKDNKILVLVQNTGTAAGTVTVKHGNGIQGVNDLDAYSVDANGIAAINLESGAFKNVSGEDKGYCLIVPSAATIKCAVVELP